MPYEHPYRNLPQGQMCIRDRNRTVTPEEDDRVLRFAERIGIERGFRQEGTAASESFIPEFDERGQEFFRLFLTHKSLSEISDPRQVGHGYVSG